MLTRLRFRNLKRFAEADIELGQAVVLIGPNNSGKTTALQALALWQAGLTRWLERRGEGPSPEKRAGVAVNRRDLVSLPVPEARLLWHNLHVRDVQQVEEDGSRKQKTQNVRIEITVEGVSKGQEWSCGLEFDYANEESFYCRPLLVAETGRRMDIPPRAATVQMALMPPMSGLAAVEPKIEAGRINVLIGEGQTAQVLRNLCYQLANGPDAGKHWTELTATIRRLFGAELLAPQFNGQRGEISMEYREPPGVQLDLSSAGRGMQHTLLLLAHLYANPGTVLLLDEPDAHLEILRQRQMYRLLTEVAGRQGSQIIAASHSEVILNEAADRDVVVAFVGSPHRIDDRGSQVLKALKDIGFDQYYQAEQTGWVLYLEGSMDLAILQAWANALKHPAAEVLEQPFVSYVANQPSSVRTHFFGLREAKPDLAGVALFDRLDRELPEDLGATGLMWTRREIENYLCSPDVLLAYARQDTGDDLFGQAEAEKRVRIMETIIQDYVPPVALRDRSNAWWGKTKASDDFLDPLFERYFRELGLPNLLRKSDYHQLAALMTADQIEPEIAEKLDMIVKVARTARPTV